MKRRILLYFFVFSLPLFLYIHVRQTVRYTELENEVTRLEAEQETWVESNKRLIAGIAVLSSSARIEYIALRDLGLVKKTPEEILQIRIDRGRRSDG